MKKIIVLSFIVLTVTAVLSGCTPKKTVNEKIGEEIAEKMIEAQTGGKVDIDSQGEKVTINSDEGQVQYSAGGQVDLPKNFPKELIVVSDAKIIMASSSDQNSTAAYVTNEEQASIKEKYISRLTGLGWQKAAEVNVSGAMMINFTKENTNVVVNIGENNTENQSGKSFVNVVFTIENE